MKYKHLVVLAALASLWLSTSWVSAENGPGDQSQESRPVVIRGTDGTALTADRIVLKQAKSEARPVHPAPAQVQLDVKLLTINWRKLRETELNLRQIIDALSVPDTRSVRDIPSEKTTRDQSSITTAVFDRAVAENVVRLLKASGAVQVKFEPTVRTENGRAANVIDGVERPLARIEETVNGQTVQRFETLRFGTNLQMTPNIRKDDDPFSSKGEIELDVSAEYRQPLPTHQHPADKLPGIRVRKFQAKTRLRDRQSLVIAEVAPFSKGKPRPSEPKPGRKATDPEGVMLIVTASQVGINEGASDSTPVPATADEASNRPAVQQVAAHAPQPVHHAQAARSGDLHRSVRELRQEVKQLRRDVHRLIEILEKRKEDEPEEAASVPKMWKGHDKVRDVERLEKSRIERALKKSVSLYFDELPLKQVFEHIASTADINVVLDNRGLAEEGVTAETPVDLEVNDVSLPTALKLILDPLRLAYRIEDGVLKITSKMRSQGPRIVATYPVADLLIPKPNENAEEFSFAGFDELKDLITRTVQPDSWNEVGGYGTIRTFETTLSLVIRHTRQGHAEIADLLTQLRELQNFQVQLEPRLIRIPESAWKELGDPEILDAVRKSLRQEDGRTLLTEEQKTVLLNAVQGHERGNLLALPIKIGHHGRCEYFVGPAPSKESTGNSLRFLAAISPDRRTVRLTIPRNGDAASARVPDQQTLLVEMSEPAAPYYRALDVPVEKVPGQDRLFKKLGSPNDRTLLLITPRIIPPEEEEEELLLGVPPEDD